MNIIERSRVRISFRNDMPDVKKVIFSSDPGNIQFVEEFINEIDRKYPICPKLYPNILITLTEAVTNAIHHGNNADINKKIALCCRVRPTKLTFRISDEGKGFNHRRIPDPTSPERIDQEDGRGVFIMKQLSDKVLFRDNGRTVEIHFSL